MQHVSRFIIFFRRICSGGLIILALALPLAGGCEIDISISGHDEPFFEDAISQIADGVLDIIDFFD